MHVEICDVSCVFVKTVKTQKQIKYTKKVEATRRTVNGCLLEKPWIIQLRKGFQVGL